jgi:hypothetical protein
MENKIIICCLLIVIILLFWGLKIIRIENKKEEENNIHLEKEIKELKLCLSEMIIANEKLIKKNIKNGGGKNI